MFVRCREVNKSFSFLVTKGPFYEHRLTLIPAWISNPIVSKMWDEITYQFSNFNGSNVEVWECVCNFHPNLYVGCAYWSMLRLTHWGRVTHICVSKLNIIASDNGLSPGRRQAIIWTDAGILLIGPLGANFSEISIGIQTCSFKKMHLKMSSAKGRLFCLGLNVLKLTKGYQRVRVLTTMILYNLQEIRVMNSVHVFLERLKRRITTNLPVCNFW